MPTQPHYKRVLLKLSGEALMGEREFGLDNDTVVRIARDIGDVVAMGVQVCLVIGGGNIFRGVSGAAKGMDRAQADYMGMLATVMNALAMQNALERSASPPACSRPSRWPASASPISAAAPMRHMEKGRVVIFAAGTGNPFFTTDTAAALRAAEMGCDALLKGTRSTASTRADPSKVPDATALRPADLSRGAGPGPAGDGRRGDQPDAGKRHPDHGVQHPRRRARSPQVMRGEGGFTRIIEQSISIAPAREWPSEPTPMAVRMRPTSTS